MHFFSPQHSLLEERRIIENNKDILLFYSLSFFFFFFLKYNINKFFISLFLLLKFSLPFSLGNMCILQRFSIVIIAGIVLHGTWVRSTQEK